MLTNGLRDGCFRKMLINQWIEGVTNEVVLNRIKEKQQL